jgi:hypothetical protein
LQASENSGLGILSHGRYIPPGGIWRKHA